MHRSANEISHLGPRNVRGFRDPRGNTPQAVQELAKNLHQFGIGIDSRDFEVMLRAYQSDQGGYIPMLAGGPIGMDADLVSPLTIPTVTTPIQFLQAWLPGFVFILTQARKIDELIGITTQGRWEDEEIVQGILERTGSPSVYQDATTIPLSSWNVNFVTRTVIRFEEGMQVGRLEELRAARMNVGSAESKRSAAAEALEIERNRVGFFGFNNGVNRTFGLLNDPGLPAFTDTQSNANWASATFQQIVGDFREMTSSLLTQSGGRIDPLTEPLTLGLPLRVFLALTTISDFGNSVMQWINETYTNVRVIGIPEFDGAAPGNDDAAMLWAEGGPDDGSTDDRRTWVQVVPSRFQTLGVEQQAKMYIEDYSNATAGVYLKRPYALIARNINTA